MTWGARGSGWVRDQTQLVDVCFADDVIMLSNIRDDAIRMFVETRDAFAQLGLTWAWTPTLDLLATRTGRGHMH
jgi:hypothetical protein